MPQSVVRRPELVFGLVGPIGCNISGVEKALSSALKSVDYTPRSISLSGTIKELIAAKSDEVPDMETLSQKIDAGNKLREIYELNGILSIGAIREIRKERQKLINKCGSESVIRQTVYEGAAYIIRQFKRKEEIDFLSAIYGRQFIQVSISQSKASRIVDLKVRVKRENPGFSDSQIDTHVAELIDRDEKEDHTYGQQVGDIFHLGDVFIDASSPADIERTTRRFVEAIFGRTNIAPSRAEQGSYFAKAVSLRSVDLSRQVGAAIVSEEGDLISVGCNEVPKPGGGNYWDEDSDKARDVDRKSEANKDETGRIIYDFLRSLKDADVLDREPEELLSDKKVSDAIKRSMIGDITEYGRMVHAEMNALCDAARLGRSVRNATMYVTTFPCHNCAKHIIASGVKEVVFIEPYPKSKTLTLFEDAFTIDPSCQEKVLVRHFSGISPRRYRDIFEKEGKRRDSSGTVKDYHHGDAIPQVPIREVDYTTAEKEALLKYLPNGSDS